MAYFVTSGCVVVSTVANSKKEKRKKEKKWKDMEAESRNIESISTNHGIGIWYLILAQ